MVSPSSMLFLNVALVAVFIWVVGALPGAPGSDRIPAGAPTRASSLLERGQASHLVVRSVLLPRPGAMRSEEQSPAAALIPDADLAPAPAPRSGARPAPAPSAQDEEPSSAGAVATDAGERPAPPSRDLVRAPAPGEAPLELAGPPPEAVAPDHQEEDEALDQMMEARATRENPLSEEPEDEGDEGELPIEAEAFATAVVAVHGAEAEAGSPEQAGDAGTERPLEGEVPEEEAGDAGIEGTLEGEVPKEQAPEPGSEVAPEVAVGPTTMELYRREVRAASARIAEGEVEAGLAKLDAVLKLEDVIGEQRAWALYLKAKGLRRLGRHRQAARCYGEAIDHDPPGPLYKNSLAWLLATTRDVHLRDAEAAVGLATEAVEQGGARANFLDTLARAHFEAGDLAEAVRVQTRAVRERPGKASFRNRLSWYQKEWARSGAVLAGAP